jgi:hypothetical protein
MGPNPEGIMNGKGSKPRPLAVSRDDYRTRWNETFRPKKPLRKPEASKAQPART